MTLVGAKKESYSRGISSTKKRILLCSGCGTLTSFLIDREVTGVTVMYRKPSFSQSREASGTQGLPGDSPKKKHGWSDDHCSRVCHFFTAESHRLENLNQDLAWWGIPVISALKKMGKEFKGRLGDLGSPGLTEAKLTHCDGDFLTLQDFTRYTFQNCTPKLWVLLLSQATPRHAFLSNLNVNIW